jgi:protein-tyrosine phosphatase
MTTNSNQRGSRGTEIPGDGPQDAGQRDPDFRILFVCMGNICRSPTAEGVFRHIARREAPELTLEIDSAGTHGYHVGEPPDPRAQQAAARRGIDLSGIAARQFVAEDYARFDLILAMDRLNVALLREQHGEPEQAMVRLFLEYAPRLGRDDVPDPYYGGSTGFELVLDLVEEASRGLLAQLRAGTIR